jgi:hypothetical protein
VKTKNCGAATVLRAYGLVEEEEEKKKKKKKLQIVELLIMQYFLVSCHFIPCRFRYFFQHPVSYNLNVCLSLNMR